MKIWIAEMGERNKGGDVFFVFDSYEKAKAWLVELERCLKMEGHQIVKKKNRLEWGCDWATITEWEIT